MADALVQIRRRTGLGLGGKTVSSGVGNSKSARGSVRRVHEVCACVVPDSGSCRVRVPVGLEMGSAGSARKSGLPQLTPQLGIVFRRIVSEGYVSVIRCRSLVGKVRELT